MFSPSFTPPPAGTYELPAIKRVPAFVLRDAGGHRVSTQAVTAGKVAVVSFIYTACSDRLGCPLASLALQSLQARVDLVQRNRPVLDGVSPAEHVVVDAMEHQHFHHDSSSIRQ